MSETEEPQDLEILKDLKGKHRFVMQMLRYGHLPGGQTQAAIAAGYSPRTASQQATRLMLDPKVKAHLAMELSKRADRAIVTPERIIAKLESIAFADMAELATWEANQINIRDSADLTPEVTGTIQSISETKIKGGGRKIEIKQHDQLKALELLGKTLCMFKDKQADPTAQIGGVLRVPSRQSVDEWEQDNVGTPAPVTEEEP